MLAPAMAIYNAGRGGEPVCQDDGKPRSCDASPGGANSNSPPLLVAGTMPNSVSSPVGTNAIQECEPWLIPIPAASTIASSVQRTGLTRFPRILKASSGITLEELRARMG